MTIVLLQPKYPHGGNQTYLPGSLMNLGSRLLVAGYEVEVFDLNQASLDSPTTRQRIRKADVIGITILGTPYIPVVILLVTELRKMGCEQRILIGGEGVLRISHRDFIRLFDGQGDVVQAYTDADIVRALGLRLLRLPDMFETSTRPMLQQLTDTELRRYLTREFCLFLSYGCIYNCHFCAAAKDMRERYRNMDALRDEVEYICEFLARIGHPTLEIYLSNLDILQSAPALEESLALVCGVASAHGIELVARGLATTHFTCHALHRDPNILNRLRRLGLRTIGFGADGADIRVWARENKKHNTLEELDEAVNATREAGMTPEILMVTGFPEDDLQAMFAAYRYSLSRARHGAIIRPYLGKQGAPGSKTWSDDRVLVESYLKDPERFRLLDYSMFASSITHPHRAQRWLANVSYAALLLTMSFMTRYTTAPLIPVPRNGGLTRLFARIFNAIVPADR